MWARGQIVNRPSQPSERPVGSSILLVPATTPQPTPTGSPTSTPEPTPTPTPTSLVTGVRSLAVAEADTDAMLCAGLRDPASTGGLLDYLERRRPRGFSDPLLRRALQVYRGVRDCDLGTPRS